MKQRSDTVVGFQNSDVPEAEAGEYRLLEDDLVRVITSWRPAADVRSRLTDFVAHSGDLPQIQESSAHTAIHGSRFSAYLQKRSRRPDILQFPLAALPSVRVIVCAREPGNFAELEGRYAELEAYLVALSEPEQVEIARSMPLLASLSSSLEALPMAGFALVWRDHFLEENIPLLRGFESAGVPREWIFPIAKGDRTVKRDRIAAYFNERGYQPAATLRNMPDPSPRGQTEQAAVLKRIESFARSARQNGRKVMLVDDGGVLGTHFSENQALFDCGIEVTVVGVKRLRALASLEIPIFDMGLSDLKTAITYREIAASCVRRIGELIPGEKIIGRRVLVLGFGNAGVHVVSMLHASGAQVAVVDTDALKLIEAAELGYQTFTSASAAIAALHPFLTICCTGEVALSWDDFCALDDGAYVTGIATRDLEVTRGADAKAATKEWIPQRGWVWTFESGKRLIQLGDGQSINLFYSEAIPNRGNDVFKAGILIAASALASEFQRTLPGVHLDRVNAILRASGLYEKYYLAYAGSA